MNDSAKAQREKLRSELRKFYGSINEIARRRGCTREWVRLVLRSSGNDEEVLKIAAEVLKERKTLRQKAEEVVQLALTA
jgi:DNA invertase Pin-like site-specific DNA recombinase